jgi:hypothetical protein
MIVAPTDRTEPATRSERAQLEGWLDFHRDTLLTKCAGLSDEQLRTAPLPFTNLTLLGLLRHCIVVEEWWFQVTFAGTLSRSELSFNVATDREGDFANLTDTSVDDVAAAFIQTCERSRDIAADQDLLTLAHNPRPEEAGIIDLRWIHFHMIEEYARHNGHADLLRQAIDGQTGV